MNDGNTHVHLNLFLFNSMLDTVAFVKWLTGVDTIVIVLNRFSLTFQTQLPFVSSNSKYIKIH